MTSLRDPFDKTHTKTVQTKRGEVSFTYVSWSQVADRLDEAAPGWSFTIRQLGDDWCWGQLTIGGQTFDNIGYAENADQAWKGEVLKDAVSDALKRCAALAGVARYLYDKDSSQGTARAGTSSPVRAAAPRPIQVTQPSRSSTAVPDDDFEFAALSPTPPGQSLTWPQLADLATAQGLEKRVIYQTADKLYGRNTKVTELDGPARYAIAVEMGLVAVPA